MPFKPLTDISSHTSYYIICMYILGTATTVFICWVSTAFSIIHFSGSDLLSSIYWCFTVMTTCGYGDILPESGSETLFSLFVCIIGPCVFTTIIANVTSYLSNEDISTDNVEHRRSVIRQFLQYIEENCTVSDISDPSLETPKAKNIGNILAELTTRPDPIVTPANESNSSLSARLISNLKRLSVLPPSGGGNEAGGGGGPREASIGTIERFSKLGLKSRAKPLQVRDIDCYIG